MDVRGFEERGRWRQPDEGSGGVQHTTPAVPSPQPLSRWERGFASRSTDAKLAKNHHKTRTNYVSTNALRHDIVKRRIPYAASSTHLMMPFAL